MNFIKLLAAATTLATGAFGEYGTAFAIGPSWDRTHPACLDFITNPIDLFVTSHPLPLATLRRCRLRANAAFQPTRSFRADLYAPGHPHHPDHPRPFRFIDTTLSENANFC